MVGNNPGNFGPFEKPGLIRKLLAGSTRAGCFVKIFLCSGSTEGMVAENPRKRGKRYLNCTQSKSRIHGLILRLLMLTSVQ